MEIKAVVPKLSKEQFCNITLRLLIALQTPYPMCAKIDKCKLFFVFQHVCLVQQEICRYESPRFVYLQHDMRQRKATRRSSVFRSTGFLKLEFFQTAAFQRPRACQCMNYSVGLRVLVRRTLREQINTSAVVRIKKSRSYDGWKICSNVNLFPAGMVNNNDPEPTKLFLNSKIFNFLVRGHPFSNYAKHWSFLTPSPPYYSSIMQRLDPPS